MINAYDKIYVYDAMSNLGEAFDYAVNTCKIDAEDFMKLFISTGFAEKFEKGNPRVIAGLSGTELAMEILTKSNILTDFPDSLVSYERSREYWGGYVLAYYQWTSGMSFKEINKKISMWEILKMYNTLHEASEEKFVDTINNILRRRKTITKLQAQRKICGYTQKELSIKSGINLRTLQQYETRAKNLENASISSVINLSKALKCNIEDLIEG